MAGRAELAGTIAAAAAEPELGAEQLPLLPPSRFEPGDHRHTQMVESVRRHGAGRPPGARNVATRDMLAFIRRTLGDPVLERARILQHTPESLALELNCSRLEAFDRLDRIRSELGRLYYAPLAPVDGAGQAVAPVLNVMIGGQGAAPGAAARPPWLYDGGPVVDVPSEQNQGVSGDAAAVPHGALPHGDGK